MRDVTLLAVCFVVMCSADTDPFSCFWESSYRELATPVPLAVTGSIPAWLRGSIIRNAGGEMSHFVLFTELY